MFHCLGAASLSSVGGILLINNSPEVKLRWQSMLNWLILDIWYYIATDFSCLVTGMGKAFFTVVLMLAFKFVQLPSN